MNRWGKQGLAHLYEATRPLRDAYGRNKRLREGTGGLGKSFTEVGMSEQREREETARAHTEGKTPSFPGGCRGFSDDSKNCRRRRANMSWATEEHFCSISAMEGRCSMHRPARTSRDNVISFLVNPLPLGWRWNPSDACPAAGVL